MHLHIAEAWLRIAHSLIATANLGSNRVVTVSRLLSQTTYPIAVFLRGSQYLVALGVSLNLTVLPTTNPLRICLGLDGYIADLLDEKGPDGGNYTVFLSKFYLNLKGSHLLLTSMHCQRQLLPDVSVIRHGQTPELFVLLVHRCFAFHRSKSSRYQYKRLPVY